MEFLNLFLYLSITVPLSIVLIMSKSKTKSLVCFVIIGLTVALFCGELNGVIFRLLPYSQNAYVTTFSPMIEELLKIFPIFICAFTIKPTRQDIIERAIAVGVGFAILENAFVFASSVNQIDVLTAVLRAFGAGMMHVMTMLFVGFGLSFIYQKRKLFLSGSIGLIATAIIYHSIYNYLVCCEYYVAGFLMPTLLFIPSMLFIKKICRKE
ncbi:MAG: PrsW family intramembrane metalloprotease [Clostridia bacterium]|nr:PrsW family intramembrane metalloprotease [Clostridia bacterium]